MAAVGLKIRASIVTAIYRKTLTVSSSVLNRAFSVGEITNFMSTDADRIVNSCPSFHAFWSIPLQVSVVKNKLFYNSSSRKQNNFRLVLFFYYFLCCYSIALFIVVVLLLI